MYRRECDYEYLGQFRAVADAAAGIDGVSETDGIDVTSANLGPAFANGLFIAQDGRNIAPAEQPVGLSHRFRIIGIVPT
ncbi:MAG: phytase, partial [Gammaproteobacteria bacterium]|nr:phytase [Gammaproteobacteria bacterium]